MPFFNTLEVYDSDRDIDQLLRVDCGWLLRVYDDRTDRYSTSPVSDAEAAQWLLGHGHDLPGGTSWGGFEADSLHHAWGLWLLATEREDRPGHWALEVGR